MSLKYARILVTGAAGFIGSRLVQWLQEVEGAQVVAFVRQFKSASRIARYPCELRIGDVTHLESLRMAARGCTHIVHAALSFAGTAAQNRRVTVEGASNVCRVARETRCATDSLPGHDLCLRQASSRCAVREHFMPAEGRVGRDKPAAERVVNSAIRQGCQPSIFGCPSCSAHGHFGPRTLSSALLWDVSVPDGGRELATHSTWMTRSSQSAAHLRQD